MTPMDELFQIRDQIIRGYKRYERFIVPILRFMAVISVLFTINNTIGYAKPLTKITAILILALIGILSPPRLLMFGLMLLISFHIGAGSIEVGILVFIIFLLIYLLFIRLYPTESLFIIAMLIAYKFHMPYIVPLFAGLFSSAAASISVIIGTMVWYSVPQLIVIMQAKMLDLPSMAEVLNANIIALQEVFKTDQTMIASMVILSVVSLTVYLIRKQAIDYAQYIAILVGGMMNIIGFVFAILLLKIDVGLGSLIISTIISAIIATIAQFFSRALDYSRTETVQFEDEENYYYVKVVPKVIVNKPKKQVRHIYTNEDIQYKNHES